MSDNPLYATAKVAQGRVPGLQKQQLLHFLISKCLAYGVVLGASILKVPQIYKVWHSKSAAGVSLLANQIDLLAYIVSTSWGIVQGLNFRDYGENAFILLQLFLLTMMVARLQNKLRSAISVVAGELTLFAILGAGYVPTSMHKTLMSAQVLVNICSRVPQITLNVKNKGTGQLSFLTYFLAFGGGVARIMTTALNVPWEKGKLILLSQFGVAATLNFIILCQFAYYRKQSAHRNGTRRTK